MNEPHLDFPLLLSEFFHFQRSNQGIMTETREQEEKSQKAIAILKY